MGYTPCTSAVIAANFQADCDNPAFAGLKVLGVAFEKNDLDTVTKLASSKNIVTAITLGATAKTFVIEATGESAWADSGEEFDPATHTWTKNATFVAPDYGAEIAEGAIEPLCKNRDGWVVILQRKNERGEASFIIVGLEVGALVTAMSRNDTDTATAGCASITLTETAAPSSEINFFDTAYATTKTAFDALVALAV